MLRILRTVEHCVVMLSAAVSRGMEGEGGVLQEILPGVRIRVESQARSADKLDPPVTPYNRSSRLTAVCWSYLIVLNKLEM